MARVLVAALRARGADVRTVLEAGLQGKDDRSQLEWAVANGRAIYTFNVSDFCKLNGEYLELGTGHAGIIVVPRQRYTVKQQIRLLLEQFNSYCRLSWHGFSRAVTAAESSGFSC